MYNAGLKKTNLSVLLKDADNIMKQIKEKEIDLKNTNKELSKFEGTLCNSCGQKIKIK